MGQRLNIELIYQGKALANAYYHWSAYTLSAIETIKPILGSPKILNLKDFTVLDAIRLLESTGAGLAETEYDKAVALYPEEFFIRFFNRTTGLISISEEGIDNARKYEEGRIEIYLDSKTFSFDVYAACDIESFKDIAALQTPQPNYDELPIFDICFENIPFENFESFAQLYKILQKSNGDWFRVKNIPNTAFICID